MGSSATSFALSSLMCEEGDTSFFGDDDEHTGIDSPCYDPCFVLEDEEEYIEYLFRQETGFGSQNHVLSSDDCSSRYWLRSARLDAIHWIFNVSFHQPNQVFLLPLYCACNLFLVFLLLKAFDCC